MPEQPEMKGVEIKMAGGELEMLIYGYIGEDFYDESTTARSVTQLLMQNPNASLITVRINSSGGNPFDGMAMYNALKNHSARVEVHVDGIAGSSATLPMMAGDKIVMHEGTAMMIHEPSAYSGGTIEEHKGAIKMLETMRENAAKVYSDRSGVSLDEAKTLMSETTWMMPETAVQKGFADEVGQPLQIAASIDLTKFPNIPEAVVASMSLTKGNIMPEKTPATETPPAPDPQAPTMTAPVADPAPAKQPEPTAALTMAAPEVDPVKAERSRIAAVMSLKGPDTPQNIIDDAVEKGLTMEQTSAIILKHERGLRTPEQNQGAPAMHTRKDSKAQMVGALSAGLCMAAGTPWDKLPVDGVRDPDRLKSERERRANDGEKYADMCLIDYCRMALEVEGIALPSGRSQLISMAASTATLTKIFTDSVNAVIGDGFDEVEDTTSWCETGEVPNFKVNTDITMGKSSGISVVPRGGTADHITFDDEGETYSAKRHGGQLTVDEQDIIDDNFGKLTEGGEMLADEMRQVRPRLVYSLLLANGNMADGVALFDAAHGNLGSAAFSAAALQTAIETMMKQTRDGRNLAISPKYLIVPPDLTFTADIALNSSERVIASASGGTLNPLRGKGIVPVTDNYLGVAGTIDPVTGVARAGTATQWFLAASRRTIKVVTVRGSGGRPVVRVEPLKGGQWGLNWDIKHDIGAYVRDHRGLYKSTGA